MISLKVKRSSGSGNSVLQVFGKFNSFKSEIKKNKNRLSLVEFDMSFDILG